MSKSGLWGVVCLLGWILPGAVRAEFQYPVGFDLRMYVENDGGILKNNHRTDRHYTSGVKLTLSQSADRQWQRNLLRWVWDDADAPDVNTALGYSVGQNIYTPDHAGAPDERHDIDMTFGGWLYGSMFLQRQSKDSLDHLEVNLGVVGPSSLAEESQETLHHMFTLSDPVWDHQISDEPAANLIYQHRRRLGRWDSPDIGEAELIGGGGLVAGSVFRHLNGSLLARWGFNLPDDFGPGRINEPETAGVLRGIYNKAPSWRFYLYSRLVGRVVEENRFLTGLAHEVFVGDVQFGLVFIYKRMEFGYAQTFLTREYEHQHGLDDYATVTFSWRF